MPMSLIQRVASRYLKQSGEWEDLDAINDYLAREGTSGWKRAKRKSPGGKEEYVFIKRVKGIWLYTKPNVRTGKVHFGFFTKKRRGLPPGIPMSKMMDYINRGDVSIPIRGVTPEKLERAAVQEADLIKSFIPKQKRDYEDFEWERGNAYGKEGYKKWLTFVEGHIQKELDSQAKYGDALPARSLMMDIFNNTYATMAEGVPHPQKTITNLLERMVKAGKIKKFKKGREWVYAGLAYEPPRETYW